VGYGNAFLWFFKFFYHKIALFYENGEKIIGSERVKASLLEIIKGN
jgi:hypothetical protein